jgi:hypothetical protein
MELLGRGYNVLNGEYASATSTTTPLLNLKSEAATKIFRPTDSSIFALPDVVSVIYPREYEYMLSYGKTIKEYMKELNSKTKIEGSYNFFSASISAEFSQMTKGYSSYEYTRILYTIDEYCLQLNPYAKDLKKLLIPEVKKKLENEDPMKVFDEFGTHYVAGVVMGGRIVYSVITDKQKSENRIDAKLAAELSYKSLIGGLSASEEFEWKQMESIFAESSEIKTSIKGGDPNYTHDITKNFEKWAESSLTKPTFVDFISSSSLVPIWELCESESRKEVLKKAYPEYCRNKEQKFEDPDAPVALLGKWVDLVPQYDDRGSGSDLDLIVGKPAFAPNQGWRWLAQVGPAKPDSYTLPSKGLIVKELVVGALCPIDHFDLIYDDHGSGKSHSYTLWRPVSMDASYHCIGDYFRKAKDYNQPPESEYAGLTAIHQSLLVPVKITKNVEQVWIS